MPLPSPTLADGAMCAPTPATPSMNWRNSPHMTAATTLPTTPSPATHPPRSAGDNPRPRPSSPPTTLGLRPIRPRSVASGNLYATAALVSRPEPNPAPMPRASANNCMTRRIAPTPPRPPLPRPLLPARRPFVSPAGASCNRRRRGFNAPASIEQRRTPSLTVLAEGLLHACICAGERVSGKCRDGCTRKASLGPAPATTSMATTPALKKTRNGLHGVSRDSAIVVPNSRQCAHHSA